MKSLKMAILLLALAITSCEKVQIDPRPPTLAYDLPPVTPIPVLQLTVIPNSIQSSITYLGVQTVKFINTAVVVTITPLDKTRSAVAYKANGKALNTVLTITKTGIQTNYKLTAAATGQLFHSYDVDTSGGISNLVEGIPLPFDALSTPMHPVVFDATYLKCMKLYIHTCRSSFWCKTIFFTSGFGMGSAGIGWSMWCAFH